MSSSWIGALDLGTQSARFMVFDENCQELASGQTPLISDHSIPGQVEQNPFDIIKCANTAMELAATQLIDRKLISNFSEIPSKVRAIGITNQRETTILWDSNTGEPFYPAIVWNDSRCQDIVKKLISQHESIRQKGQDVLRSRCGLPLASYFSALKLKWLIKNKPEILKAITDGHCMFGTVDSWLIWNLGNREHVTDVTNASRTMLMNIHTHSWDPELLDFFDISREILLPQIKSSSEHFCVIKSGPFASVPITGCIGDQQAALVGHLCLEQGKIKNTYGTGCFLLCNTGTTPVSSHYGLLTTIAFQLGKEAPVYYALEGSVNTAGYAVSWMKDNLQLIQSSEELSKEAASVPNAGGIYFVPAFSGLFAPYWKEEARGVIVGLSNSITKAHLCRAVLESVGLQTQAVLSAMAKDCHLSSQFESIRVDGGMTKSDLLLQIQANVSGLEVHRPVYVETTAMGAAIVAGLASGVYSIDNLASVQSSTQVFYPQISETERSEILNHWENAIKCSYSFINSK